MASKIIWERETSAMLMAAELNSLNDGAFAVDGADYDNYTNQFRFADFGLFIDDFAAAPDANGTLELHLFYKLDNSKYFDGYDGDADADSEPGANTLHGLFVVSANDADQNLQVLGVRLSPMAFRACIVNECGQNLGASGNVLSIFPYNEESQ